MTDPQDPQQLREQIEETREELGDTVEALAAKTDVKAHAKRKVEETKRKVEETKSAAGKPVPLAGVGALAGGVVLWQIVKRRKAAKQRKASPIERWQLKLREVTSGN